MANHLHKSDLPPGISFGRLVAIDTETLGLRPHRDRLCVIQLSAGDGDAHVVHFVPDTEGEVDYDAPNLKALAKRSVRFRNCYTASPLCAPGRASFMSGELPSVTGVYDNAAEFPSDLPTYAHHLRRAGYHTCLSGKMYFVGQ